MGAEIHFGLRELQWKLDRQGAARRSPMKLAAGATSEDRNHGKKERSLAVAGSPRGAPLARSEDLHDRPKAASRVRRS